ncbi:MAG TPA: hypothetical protein VFF13_04710 [archaeon]|nr:hypothetical protein [archaeon]
MNRKLITAAGIIGSVLSALSWLSMNGSMLDFIIVALAILLIVEVRIQPKTTKFTHA